MMICFSAIACAYSQGLRRSVSLEPVGSSVTTAPGTTAGSRWLRARVWRCCGRESAGRRGCPTSCRRGLKSESSASRLAIPASARGGLQPSSPCRCGAASWSQPAVCSRSCVATAWALAFSAWVWSPAMPLSRNGKRWRRPSLCTSRLSSPAIWFRSTASTSAVSAALGVGPGNTPPSTSPAPLSGAAFRSSAQARATTLLFGRRRLSNWLRWLDELVLDSVANCLRARPDPHLDEDVVHVLVRRARGDAYLPRDRPVGEPAGNQPQNLGFTRAEE